MKQPKLPVKKLPKGVPQEFIDGIQSMSTDQLKAQIVLLQVQNQENEAFKEDPKVIAAEEEFRQAKESHNLIVIPIRDTSVSLKNKTKLVVERLKEKGGA